MTLPTPHLLLINQYFPPDTSATAKVADRLTRFLAQKHQITVLAGRPSYAPTEEHPYYLRRIEQYAPNIAVTRVGSTGYHRGRMRQRVLNYLSYMALALPQALSIKADVVVAMTDPPIAGLIGALTARLKRKPFIYYIQDLHPDMALASDMVQSAGWVNVWEKIHRWVLRQASCIVVLGEDMKALVVAKGIDPARIEVVRTGAEIPAELPPPNTPVSRNIRGDFDFVLLHAGNLGFYGAWETLIEAAKLVNNPTVGLIFIGDGAAKARLQTLADGNQQVKFLPFRPAADIPYVLASADLHVVTIRTGAEGVIVPSKLFPILAAGRPVLAVAPPNSDVARIINQAECGVVVDPDDPAALAATIQRLAQDPTRVTQMASKARAVAPTYAVEQQLAKFEQIVAEVLNKL